MKILISTDEYEYQVSGVTLSVITLRDQLKSMGHDVRILALSPNRYSMIKNGDYYFPSVPAKIYPDARIGFKYFGKMLKEIVEWGPDIIHTQTEFSSYILARRVNRKLKVPIIHTWHTVYEEYIKYFAPNRFIGLLIIKSLTRNVLHRSDMAVVPSRKLESIIKNFGIRTPMRIIPTGIDLEKFYQKIDSEEKKHLKEKLGLSEKDRILITLCRLGVEKNIDELLNMLPALVEKNKNIKFLIVGDGPYRKTLEARVTALKIEKNVIFAGMVLPEETYKYYQLGDIFLSASQSESQGLTYIEALANGLPLICKEDDCLTDVIYQGENGYTFTDSEGFYKHIHEILTDPDLEKTMSQRSLEVSKQFSKEIFGEKVEALYKEVIALKNNKKNCHL